MSAVEKEVRSSWTHRACEWKAGCWKILYFSVPPEQLSSMRSTSDSQSPRGCSCRWPEHACLSLLLYLLPYYESRHIFKDCNSEKYPDSNDSHSGEDGLKKQLHSSGWEGQAAPHAMHRMDIDAPPQKASPQLQTSRRFYSLQPCHPQAL